MAKLAILILSALLLTGCDGFTSIDGSVKDTENKPLEGVTLTLETSSSRAVEDKSKADGRYSLHTSHAPFRVQPKVTASKKGYKPYQKLFPLAAGTKHELDIVMEVDPEAAAKPNNKKETDETDTKSSRRPRRTQLRHHHR